jgi:hypothetical protein
MAIIPIQTTPPTPNGVYAPQILLQTGIQNGKLVTSAQVTLVAAAVENANQEN